MARIESNRIAMYTIIGYRTGILKSYRNRADDWLGRDIGDAIIGYALPIMPDGLIIQVCRENEPAQYYETKRGELVGIDPNNPGTMETQRQAQRQPEPKLKDIQIEIREAVKAIHSLTARRINGGSRGL